MRTTILTYSNPTFCPQSIFMCFVWISEQTAIISLHNINQDARQNVSFVYCNSEIEINFLPHREAACESM